MTDKVLVIGGGPAGLAAAKTLVDSKTDVVLVEREETLGGMARELTCKGVSECRNCGVCYVMDRAMEILSEPSVEVLLQSEVVSVEATEGGYRVKIKSSPRYVTGQCIECDKCSDACPVDGKAIFPPTGSGRPRAYFIDRARCLHFKKAKCTKCADACPAKAVNYDDRAKNVTRDVSAIVLATGIEAIDAGEVARLGYGRIPDVISSVDAERILNEKGKIPRPSNGDAPKKVAIIQCVGSRNEQTGVQYCSKFCCKYGSKIAQAMMDTDPDIDLDFYFMDLRTLYEPQEDFKEWAKTKKRKVEKKMVPQVRLIRSMPAQAFEAEGKVLLRSSGETDAEVSETAYDLVILSVGMRPRSGSDDLVKSLGLIRDQLGFVGTAGEPPRGVIVLGAVTEPMDIEETVVRGMTVPALIVDKGKEAVK
ncbi:TPA: CoB--CoM heterodisulfide reductase iron-sulfur subunit A family protein [Thermoplasmata archaeon]|nr:CoB--CoM heterodisulfide reductase iron-sulfur subunit A family protein [Thermoplasmata archaeon]